MMLIWNRSWRRAFLYVNDPESHADDGSIIKAFLSHPESIQLLSRSVSSFPESSPQYKTEFNSKTAAIHVETNAKKSFDLSEIKADAQWLSEKARIDEITALRIVVLEWQNRPATRLTTTFSSEEATSLQSAAGSDNLRMSVAGPNLASILKQTAGDAGSSTFNTEESRRLRLRTLYLSERSHLLKTFRKLLALSHHTPTEPVPSSTLENDLIKLGITIFREKSTGQGLYKLLEACISAVQSRLQDLETTGAWLGAAESSGEIEDIWRTTLVEEIVHILQIMFHQLRASQAVPCGALLLSWLELMLEYDFLEKLQVVSYAVTLCSKAISEF
jgi:nuclear pore complex protein Nup188